MAVRNELEAANPPRSGDKELTAKQARFVAELLVDDNATQAAVRAGYSPAWADKNGPRLLQYPHVAEAVRAAREARYEQLKEHADRIMAGTIAVAEFDPADIFDERGAVRPLKELAPAARKCIAGIEVEEIFAGGRETDDGMTTARVLVGRVSKIKFNDRLRAAELFFRLTGKLQAEMKVSGQVEHKHSGGVVSLPPEKAVPALERTPASLQTIALPTESEMKT